MVYTWSSASDTVDKDLWAKRFVDELGQSSLLVADFHRHTRRKFNFYESILRLYRYDPSPRNGLEVKLCPYFLV